MMNRLNEEEQLTMVVKNLLPVYHKYLFAQYSFPYKYDYIGHLSATYPEKIASTYN